MDTESILSKTDYDLFTKLTNPGIPGISERDLGNMFEDLNGLVGKNIKGSDPMIEEIESDDTDDSEPAKDSESSESSDDSELEEPSNDTVLKDLKDLKDLKGLKGLSDLQDLQDLKDLKDLRVRKAKHDSRQGTPSSQFREAMSKYYTDPIKPAQRRKSPRTPRTPRTPRAPRTPRDQRDRRDQRDQRTRGGEAENIDWKQMFKDTEFIPEDFSDINVEEENRNPQIRRQKQEVLFQLLKTYPGESKGQWNMRMPLFELKYELLRREQFKEEQDQIAFMKEMMKMILTGLEMLNEKFGPFLELKGWSRSVTADMSRYDRCMKALYHRYFRKKQMNPVMEMLWLIVGSAIMWHIQSKFLGGAPKEAPKPNEGQFFNNVHDIKPPPDGPKFPFNSAGPAQGAPGINIASLLKLFTR